MEFYFNKIARLQSTAHYQTKNFVTGTFQEVLKKERMFRNFKNSEKSLQNISFSLMLQACSPDFPTSTKTDSKKNVFCDCSEIVGNLPGKNLSWSHFIKVTGLLAKILLKEITSSFLQRGSFI